MLKMNIFILSFCLFFGKSSSLLHQKNKNQFNLPDFNKILLKSALLFPIAIFSTCSYDPSLVYAGTNPDAMDIRRVEQQPPGAPGSTRAKNVKLESGLIYYDVSIGDGPEVEEGKSVQFQWVLRRQNGYFVDASSNYNSEPFIYKVGNLKKVIKGVDEGIRGMHVGSVRRLLIPADLAFVAGVGDGFPGPMPVDFGPRRQIVTRQANKETWYMEIAVTKVR